MSDWDTEPPTSPYGSPASGDTRHGAPEDLPPFVARDIVNYVQQALARFATPGQVEYFDGKVRLAARPGGTHVAIFEWARDWPRMDEATRERRALEVARELAATRSLTPSAPPRTIVLDIRLVLAVLALAICCVAIWLDGRGTEVTQEAQEPERIDRRAGPGAVDAPDAGIQKDVATTGRELGDARSARVCAATMNRVYQGGTVSVADVDGWVVEVALAQVGATSPLDTHPALRELVADPTAKRGSKFIWKEQPHMVPVDTSDTLVRVQHETLGRGPARIETVVLTFSGTLVDAYFKEDGRANYYRIASFLSDQLHATHSAVYARCSDEPVHALGSWFRGLDAGAAAASLVYFMGTYAKPLHVARPFVRLPGDTEINRQHAFTSIATKTAPLVRNDLATLLGKEGGMASGRPGDHVIITFPFKDGNRASRASRSITRVTSLGH